MRNDMFGRKVILTKAKQITSDNVLDELKKAVNVHEINSAQIDYLWNYYKGNQPVLSRVKKIRPEINNKVAVSIVTYSRFGRVQYDFLDCADLDVASCHCKADKPETSMGEGLRTSLMQIDEMQADMHSAGKDAYTPILIFMSDGSPTDDPRQEFSQVRDRVEKGDLHVFPLGIGDGADMFYMRNLFPTGHCPEGFTNRYKMVKPRDYEEIFREIKTYVVQRQCVMVSEGNSIQSLPALVDKNVNNNQSGETIDFEELINRAFN